MNRLRVHDVRAAFFAVDQRLDAWVERHRPLLRLIGSTLAFAMLVAGVALHVQRSGFAHATAAACGTPCPADIRFEYLIALMCGAAAILWVKVYVAVAAAIQRRLIDPFQYVRPEPKPLKVARWVVVGHVPIGVVLFFAIAGFGQETPGRSAISIEGWSSVALIFGWWIGGAGVLQFFWSRARQQIPSQP